MVMPCPGVRMPTMRSPGTAPPSAKLTGRSPRKPLIGIPLRGLRGDLPVSFADGGAQHFRRSKLAASDSGKHVFDRLLRQALKGEIEIVFAESLSPALKAPHQDLAAELAVLRAYGIARGAS